MELDLDKAINMDLVNDNIFQFGSLIPFSEL